MPLQHFLIVYDTRTQTLVTARSLGTNGAYAVSAYAEKERECRDESDFEIVLIGADSLDTIKQTHPHYFDDEGSERASRFFDALTVE